MLATFSEVEFRGFVVFVVLVRVVVAFAQLSTHLEPQANGTPLKVLKIVVWSLPTHKSAGELDKCTIGAMEWWWNPKSYAYFGAIGVAEWQSNLKSSKSNMRTHWEHLLARHFFAPTSRHNMHCNFTCKYHPSIVPSA